MHELSDSTWRFLDTGAAAGPFNMAADEVLATSPDVAVATLRLYRWQPWTISLGYHQDANEINLARSAEHRLGVVRRQTGGRAILHAHELTYSVILPIGCRWYEPGKSSHVHNHISQALVVGLQEVGLNAMLEARQRASREFKKYHNRTACFAAAAKYEIQCDSRKLVGSAQRKYRTALLQHGSIILGEQHLALMDYLASANGSMQSARERLHQKTISIETILRRNVTYEEAASAIKTGFQKHFNISFQQAPLTSEELKRIDLLSHKFANLGG